MGDWFGLGIMIQVRDFASQGLAQVTNAFNSTRQAIDNFSSQSSESLRGLSDTAEQHFQSMTIAGLGMQQAGSQFLNFSNSMISPLKNITSEVVKTSAQFENWKKTLKALYKDEDLASQKLDWGMKLASTTPFEVSDVTEALIAFKAIGAEADTVLTSTNGVKQSVLEFVGDLASLRPDVGLSGVMMGVRNLIGGDGGKSLKMRMDMDLEAILGRNFGDTTEQIMQDLADVSGKIANGLMGELEGTWDQIVSNLEDQKTRFFKAMGDAGVFDAVKGSLKSFADVISSIDDAKMARIGKNLSEAFTMIWKPIDFVVKGLSNMAKVIIELASSNSFLGKLVTGFLAVGGAVTGLIGVVLIFGGSLITTISSLGLFLLALRNASSTMGGVRVMFQLLGNTVASTLTKLMSFAGGLALAFALWHYDVGGIRTVATNFINTIADAFQRSTELANMGAKDMINAMNKLDMTNFGDRLTYRLLQVQVFWKALCEAWNDYTLSEETFKKVEALGLLPLLNTILDFKMKFDAFWKGFKQGFKEVSSVLVAIFSKVGEAVGHVLNFLLPINTEIKKTKKAVGEGLNLVPWEIFGTMIGGIASVFATAMIASKVFGIAKAIGSLGLTILKLPFKILFNIGGAINFVLGIVGKLGGVISKLLPWVFNFAKGLMSLGMAHPVIAVIVLVLSALLPLFIRLWKESESFREGVIALGTNLLSILGMVGLGILSVIGTIITGVIGVVTVIAQVLATVGVIVGSVVAIVSTIVASVVAFIVGLIATAVSTIITTITLIVATVQTVGLIISGVFQTAFAIVQGIIQTFLAVVKAVMTGDFKSLGSTIKGIWKGVGDNIRAIWQGVATKVKSIWQGVQSFLSGLWGGMKSLWSGICNGIKSAGTNVVNGIKSAWRGVTGFFSGIWSGIKSGASSMFSWISSKFSWLSDKITSAKTAMSKIGSGISSVFGKKDGSHANGLSYVPYDGYVAELHKGEMVLTAQESKKYRKQSKGLLDDMIKLNPTLEESNKSVNPVSPINLPTPKSVDNKVELNQLSNVNPIILGNTSPNTNASKEPQSVDNSITFSEGSIVFNVQNGTDLDLDSVAKDLMKKIQREMQLRSTLRYNPVV